MTEETTRALIQLGSGLLGGIISAGAAVLTLRGTLGNQLRLEEKRFQYQRELEAEKRDHEASAFRRKALRAFRRLHNTARMDGKSRQSVPAWKRATTSVQNILNTPDCEASLTDTQYDAAWRACEESQAAIMFLEAWAAHQSDGTLNAVLIMLSEYHGALEACFRVFCDEKTANEVREASDRNFKGVRFWMTDGDGETVCPFP